MNSFVRYLILFIIAWVLSVSGNIRRQNITIPLAVVAKDTAISLRLMNNH